MVVQDTHISSVFGKMTPKLQDVAKLIGFQRDGILRQAMEAQYSDISNTETIRKKIGHKGF
uniref:Uncharacterized protein n=1 Tax=Salix viminalis TaxID=40686 RepID=A0A6N2M9J5_SALVM